MSKLAILTFVFFIFLTTLFFFFFLAGLGRDTNKRIADAWRVAFGSGHRSVDDEEFLITTELVSSTLACLASTPISAIPDFRLFYAKLRLFCELQQEYESHVIRSDQLLQFQTNRTTRRKVSRLNSHVHMEIKWVLAASGITNSLQESLAIRKRSLSRITVQEGQAMWEAHFSDLDMDMVPWDRFLGAFMMQTKLTVDMHDEILLKHILDNDTLGTVTPKQFSSFLKCFGPLDKSLDNVKNLYKQKWFHDFLSVEEVHKLLTEQPPGTFLVRFSRSHSNSFALEYTYTSGKVFTVLIRNDMPNGVYIKEENNVEKMFPNLDALIKHYPDILKHPFQNDLVIQPWFVGDVSTEEAEEMLAAKPPGTFMVRFAASGRFQYACSFATLQGVKHTMIQKGPNGYLIEETRAAPTPSLITTGTSLMPLNASVTIESSSMPSSNDPSSSTSTAATGSNSATSSGGTGLTSSASIANPASSNTTATSPTIVSSQPATLTATSSGGLPTSPLHHHHSTSPSATPTVYPSLEQFLRVAGAELRYNYDADNVPNLKVSEFMETDRYVDLSGPHDVDGHGAEADFMGGAKVFAQTIASYPKTCLGWEVICDQWHVRLLGNRIVFALADGCNWGTKVRQAADAACRAIIDQVADRDVQSRIRDTMEARHYLLRSFSVAHEHVVNAGAGTTTLLAGILMEVDPNADEWALVAASVGDCKAFVYMTGADRCVDVTLGNRRNLRDARDPGGRLGDSDGQKQPDLRNLQSYFWPMRRNDILMLVSDGIHDNLDPESFGKQPKELVANFTANQQHHLAKIAAEAKSWDDLDQDTTEKLKSGWMLARMHSIIKAKEMTAKSVSTALIDYVLQTTAPSRNFMEANPDKPEPSDHVEYPGKMDHTSCIAFHVGPLFKDLVPWRHRPMVARPMTATSSVPQLTASGGLAGSLLAAGAKKSVLVLEDPRSEARRQNIAAGIGGSSSSMANTQSSASSQGNNATNYGGQGQATTSSASSSSHNAGVGSSYSSGSAATTSTNAGGVANSASASQATAATTSVSQSSTASTTASTMLTNSSFANSSSTSHHQTSQTNNGNTANSASGHVGPSFFNNAGGGTSNSRPTSPYGQNQTSPASSSSQNNNAVGSASPLGSNSLTRTVTSPGLSTAPLSCTPILFRPLESPMPSSSTQNAPNTSTTMQHAPGPDHVARGYNPSSSNQQGSSQTNSSPSLQSARDNYQQYQLQSGRTIMSYIDLVHASFPWVPLAPYVNDYSLQIGNAFPGDCELTCSSLACGRSNSTYPAEPAGPGGAVSAQSGSANNTSSSMLANSVANSASSSVTKKRMGDPNTTTFCLDATPTRITFSVAVGQNWGAAAADASYRACHSAFRAILDEQPDNVENSRDAAILCVRALDKCQQSISETSPDAQASVMLLCGILAQTATPEKRWMSVLVTLGNNKVFLWKRSSQKVLDLTHRKEGMDRRDSAGFLSTDPKNSPSSLKNLCISFGDVDPDDVIIVMTPGAYYNFDPELLGVSPQSEQISPPIMETEWSPTLEHHIRARANYRTKIMEQLLSSVAEPSTSSSSSSSASASSSSGAQQSQFYPLSSQQQQTLLQQGSGGSASSCYVGDEPKRFAIAIIDYCKRITAPVREFMEANPKATEPKDRSLYPGKMGHAMCLAIRAGKLSTYEAQTANNVSARSALLSTQGRPMAR